MSTDERCGSCGKRLRRCDCGAADGRPHWIDLDHLSRWCPNGKQKHEPEVPDDPS